ncbi:ECF RNA polymerase sigma factor SigW [Ruminiclostridium hungatei]|uniref:ECF RNA polymerase sigma factor SigW n=1 Tax=Ruminiclostridium hungatei TaxID=48256 RepID=A0A1V4SQQ3_RUMHU|nr:RNA polymerase sigma factor [Ruminiclostridium hungatei]OPX45796.1 ECF RNA polymerase sigma factor SigW [Ruminiclostridium hungatei]
MELYDIILRYQNGDSDSFEELYKNIYRKTYGTAFNILGIKAASEDIVQEAFIICYKSIHRLKNPEAFNTWFYRIVVRLSWRLAKDPLRHTWGEDFESQVSDNTDQICSRLDICEKIRTLKIPLRTVLILYYFNEMSVKEISQVLGCLEGTVKSRLFKARKILQSELFPDSIVNSQKKFKEVGLNE